MEKTEVKSLYVHIPFCSSICSYCDFCKFIYHKPWILSYLTNLNNEIIHLVKHKKLETIYIGGGTPSVLNEMELEILLTMLKPYSQHVVEYTIEVNPETLTEEKVKLFNAFGINRISLGVQTFDQEILKKMGRQHTNQEVYDCISLLKAYDIPNISIDLLYGIEGITKKIINYDLMKAQELDIPHVSYYSLILEQHTLLHNMDMLELSQEKSSEFYQYICQQLCNSGYYHYEVSNFAKVGFESKHNSVYWNNQQYYGVGCGASGYIGSIRYSNTKSINKYLKGVTIFEEIKLDAKQQAFETLMLGLRLTKGVSMISYRKHYGETLYQVIQETINRNIQLGLLTLRNNYLKTTSKGMLLLDSVLLDFLEILS